jgi:hypothetical protein
MTGTPDTDDSWAEFYREIGLEPEHAETALSAPVDHDNTPAPSETESPDSEADEEDEGGEEAAESDGTSGEEELNEDGTKKRRRRRRRRSKKKGPGAGDEAGAEGEVPHRDAQEPQETLAEVYDDDGGPSPEASRELIANWDVPSWTEIVAGLHRPNR